MADKNASKFQNVLEWEEGNLHNACTSNRLHTSKNLVGNLDDDSQYWHGTRLHGIVVIRTKSISCAVFPISPSLGECIKHLSEN